MSTVTVTLPEDTASIAAPPLLGYMFNWGLFGALTVQVYLYYISFPKDRWQTKVLVYSIYVVEMAQTILVVHDAFNAYAKSFGNMEELNAMQNEWLAVPVFSAIVSCTVQMYYAYRIQILSGSLVLRIVVSLVALTQGAASLVAGIKAFLIGNFSEFPAKSFIASSIWLVGSAVCDVFIAICMAYYLSRKAGSIPGTQAIVARLVRLTIETGTLTAVMATIDLVLFLAFPHSDYYTAIALILAKLYSNSLMMLFNNRIRIVDGRNYASESLCISYHGRITVMQHQANSGPDVGPMIFNSGDAVLDSSTQNAEDIWVQPNDSHMQSQTSPTRSLFLSDSVFGDMY